MSFLSTAVLEPRDLPPTTIFRRGTFINHRGLQLTTFSFERKSPDPPKGVVYLAHGYASHTLFDWLLPAAPGERHDTYAGSVIAGLVDAGFAVRALDHTGHGHSLGPRCYFDSFDDLVVEAGMFIEQVVKKESGLAGLPVFLFGLSMGGATVVKMALRNPLAYRGLVLYAPMLSLNRVKQEVIAGPVRNSHLEGVAGCISCVVPMLPIAKPALNTHNPLSQQEMDQDCLTYSGDCRARVAHQFMMVTDGFMDGDLSLLNVPFVTFHSVRDTFTDPEGSEVLYAQAAVADKTHLRVGPGCDVDVDIWHALAAEPGREVIFGRARAWLEERT